MNKDPTAAERKRRHRENDTKRGLVRVEVKVPAECKEEVIAFAKKLNESKNT